MILLAKSAEVIRLPTIYAVLKPLCSPIYRVGLIAILSVFAVIDAGCREPEAAQDAREQQAKLQRADRGEALINAAANQLADLPAAVDTELRPPTVVLDSTKTLDGQDVFAVAVANPSVEGNPINLVVAPAGNGRFKSIGVRSGDILKFYVIEDETVDEERRQAGFSRQLAKQLTVAQVVDNNTLLIEGSLPEQVLAPAKLEVWRNVDDRLEEINEKLVRYAERRLPPLGWEPSPDSQVITQIITWLNQWMRQSEPKVEWQREPMLDSLDEELRADENLAPFLTVASLASPVFEDYDGQRLQEAVWVRDIARWAQGDDFSDLARATALFDWTIRNIQLTPDENAPPHRPWRTLADGRGTAEERAWVFALLCRQQALDVVMLEIPPAENATEIEQQNPFWLPAVVIDGKLYLFDTRLGLPIPGAGGSGVATLDQVQQDDSLLRQLDIDGSSYPVDSTAAKRAIASIVASPFELSKRARQLESKLTGDNHLVLSVAPSKLAESLKSVPGPVSIQLWSRPFRTLRDQLTLGKNERTREALAFEPFAKRPLLWKARMRHLQGRQAQGRSDDDTLDDHREASQLYTSNEVRPTDTKLARISDLDERRVDTAAKQDATYWVGLLAYDDGKYAVSVDWLERVDSSDEASGWTAGKLYNLARAWEAQGQINRAAKLLEKDTSPQRHGNLLRARQLEKRASAEESDTSQNNAPSEGE